MPGDWQEQERKRAVRVAAGELGIMSEPLQAVQRDNEGGHGFDEDVPGVIFLQGKRFSFRAGRPSFERLPRWTRASYLLEMHDPLGIQ